MRNQSQVFPLFGIGDIQTDSAIFVLVGYLPVSYFKKSGMSFICFRKIILNGVNRNFTNEIRLSLLKLNFLFQDKTVK